MHCGLVSNCFRDGEYPLVEITHKQYQQQSASQHSQILGGPAM